ncbi:MAG: dihydrolipoamide succinyltransferase, partial [Betaproteobacteria bacterium]
MRIEVKVPVLPESITEATLVNWHKKAGESVKRDENLIDIETDKVVLELPAPNAGVLTEIRKPDGSTVTAEEVIAVIDTEGKGAEAAAAPAAKAPAGATKAPTAPTAKASAEATAKAPAAPARASSFAPSTATATPEATALPAARKMMAEQNIG